MSSPIQNELWYNSNDNSNNNSGNNSDNNSCNTNDNNSNEELLIEQLKQILEENVKPINCADIPKKYSEKFNKNLSDEISNLYQKKLRLKEFFNHPNIINFFRLSYTQPSNGPKIMWIKTIDYFEQDKMQDFNQDTVPCDQDKDNSSKSSKNGKGKSSKGGKGSKGKGGKGKGSKGKGGKSNKGKGRKGGKGYNNNSKGNDYNYTSGYWCKYWCWHDK